MRDKILLRQLQALPLDAKILMTQQRIREWYHHFAGDVCISFSGGKDSTVLAHLVHEMYPDVPMVFANTGLEYPEIQAFARKMGAEFVRPKMSFPEVISKYGYPLISKEVAEAIHFARRIVAKNPGSLDFLEREREREYRLPSVGEPNWTEHGTTQNCSNRDGMSTRPRTHRVPTRNSSVEPGQSYEQPAGHENHGRTGRKCRKPSIYRERVQSFRNRKHGTRRSNESTSTEHGQRRDSEYRRIQRARRWLMGKD